MSEIRVNGLSKAYKVYPNQWARLLEWLFPFAGRRHREHWVLTDIDLHLKAGEAVGIIGNNGAGKSTLLKLITGTIRPNRGSIEVSGRVAALLELGMGFHPDFTGRQNAMMGGQLLGLTMEEIQSLMPEIEAFAEIGDYIDKPVRTYSSGMQMRLAFSVATARRPDVLIVDEALSVGDSYFQHKSFDRIHSFNREGTTLLIVSHDRYAIQRVCDRAVLLDAGRICRQGEPIDVLDYYNAMMAERDHKSIRQSKLPDGSVTTVSGSGEASILGVCLTDDLGKAVDSVEVGDSVQLQVRIGIHAPIPRMVLGFMITDRLGQPIYGINTHRLDRPLENLSPGEEITYRFKFVARLGQGSYRVALSVSRRDSHLDKNYEWRDNALVFQVLNTRHEDFVGCNWLSADVDIKRTSLEPSSPNESDSSPTGTEAT